MITFSHPLPHPLLRKVEAALDIDSQFNKHKPDWKWCPFVPHSSSGGGGDGGGRGVGERIVEVCVVRGDSERDEREGG